MRARRFVIEQASNVSRFCYKQKRLVFYFLRQSSSLANYTDVLILRFTNNTAVLLL